MTEELRRSAQTEQRPGRVRVGVSGCRYVTHMLRLYDVDTALANFFAALRRPPP